jgi:hypothetical protein
MSKQVFILFEIHYKVIKEEVRGFIYLKSLSPIINKNIKFTIAPEKEHYSFDQLREKLKESYFKKEDVGIMLSVVNQKTGEEQKFGITLTEEWPEDLAGDTLRIRPARTEITEYLEKIGILD